MTKPQRLPTSRPPRRRVAMVTGARLWTKSGRVFADLDEFNPHVVIHGGAYGTDNMAHEWCRKNGRVAHVHFPNYDRDGQKAPLFRNKEMALELRRMTDAYNAESMAFAYLLPSSRGTHHAIQCLKDQGFEPVIREEKE